MISRQKLKPCPFCGGEPKIHQAGTNIDFFRIVCFNCFSDTGNYYTEEEAIEAWNRRESQPPADQWIPCSERLPEDTGYYETTIDILGCRLNQPICFDTVENRWLANHCVIAWRERLEPYKGERK